MEQLKNERKQWQKKLFETDLFKRRTRLKNTKHTLFLQFDSSLFLTCETDTVTVKLIMSGQQLFRGTVNTT